MASERILVVEDTPSVAKLVATHLEAAGYHAEIALSGPEALQRLATGPLPDLILIDIMMPGMDGFELTSRIRSDPRTAQLPIIMLTARDAVEDKVRGFEAGADDYVTKPFEAAELLARIRVLLGRSRAQRPPAEEVPSGAVIACFGLRGGAGRTVVAANLAIGLAEVCRTIVGACDLAVESGHLALALDARPAHSIDELIARYGVAFEQDVLEAYLARTDFGVQLLGAPRSPASAPLVSPEGARAVVSQLRRRFPYVVVDMAPTFSELTLAVLDVADLVLVVTTPEVAGVKSALAAIEVLESLGHPPEGIAVVVNTVFAGKALSKADIEEALGKPVRLFIPYDRVAFLDQLNRGIPVLRGAARSPAARAISEFAAEVHSLFKREAKLVMGVVR